MDKQYLPLWDHWIYAACEITFAHRQRALLGFCFTISSVRSSIDRRIFQWSSFHLSGRIGCFRTRGGVLGLT